MPKQWLPSAIALPSALQILSSNIFILTLLYFVQGIPYGFQARFLPVYLRANGTSLTTLGFIKLLLLPWLLKVIWAPLVDKWGTKRQWLLYSVFGLALTCLCGAAVSPKVLLYVCPVIFLLNFLAATQDIAVDGIAISILREDELGKGNTAQVVGYKLGSIAGGGFLVLLNDYVGWSGLFLNLTAVYFVTLAIIKQIPDLETSNKVKRGKGEKINAESRSTLPGHQKVETTSLAHVRETCSHTVLRNGKLIKTNEHTSAITETADNQWENAKGFRCDEMCSAVHEEPIRMTHVSQWFDAVLSVPGTMWIAAFVLLYKLGEQGANGMFPLYMVDCGISASYVGLWTGVIGQSLSILGSLLSGWILSYSVSFHNLNVSASTEWRADHHGNLHYDDAVLPGCTTRHASHSLDTVGHAGSHGQTELYVGSWTDN
ncbi:major facilitator superfamily domain-containing protein 3-like isoform X2 [Ptychodera flava]|uniref:major facilitator superfamily domain-containing protein 3-like isoform X2 n=1 Tax=Ptychodera flava TaxID=63121 RepID=UPI00396A1E4A